MSRRRFAMVLSAVFAATVVARARVGETAGGDAGVRAGGDAGVRAGGDAGVRAGGDAGVRETDGGSFITIAGQRTVVIRVEPHVGRPIEREPGFLRHAPSYHRAIEMDRDQRWAEAAGLYQQALLEIGAAARFGPTPLLEQATFKIDLERRRSRTLAQAMGGDVDGARPSGAPRIGAASPATPATPSTLPPLDRGRLLRQKLMAIRAATGAIPAGLVSATLGALGQALRKADAGTAGGDETRRPRSRGGDPEVRLLLCATRAVAGDRAGARLEQAHVSRSDRTDPARALAFAACQAALGYDDQALASLAVVVHRLGPTSRFLPGQARELQSANDWDTLRVDPRFERLFR